MVKAKTKKTKAKTKKTKKAKAKKAKAKVKAPNVMRAFERIGKKRKTSKPKRTPTSAELAPLAMAGDVEALVVLLEPFSDDSLNDTLLYKWLDVASDFGPTVKHRKAADDLTSDLLECSTLRYDDDQGATGEAHFELGVAYLTATEHLPRDLERASAQLAMAKERYYPWQIQGATKLIAKTRKALDPEARAVFDAIYDGTKPAASDSDDGDDEDY